MKFLIELDLTPEQLEVLKEESKVEVTPCVENGVDVTSFCRSLHHQLCHPLKYIECWEVAYSNGVVLDTFYRKDDAKLYVARRYKKFKNNPDYTDSLLYTNEESGESIWITPSELCC